MSALPSPLKSPMPLICQSEPTWAGAPLEGRIVVPSINQMEVHPVEVCCQRMSALPSPLKSPMPLICQSEPTWAGAPLERDSCSVHNPDVGPPSGGLLPEDVCLTISIEVTNAFDPPVRADLGRSATGGKDSCSIHHPDVGPSSGGLLPEDICLAISIEITNAFDLPVEIRLSPEPQWK